jgi:N-acetylglutamate synthase-like GNAT family acetyltransferase
MPFSGAKAMPQPVIIREFQTGDESAFRKLNEEWIARYFGMEQKDEAILGDPKSAILDSGGRIFLAILDGEPVGCCALIHMSANEFEVAKMGVTASCQGRGVGRQLLEAVVEAARNSGVRRLYLETNDQLTTAIRLYESAGFQHVPAERIVPSPYARANVRMELYL